MKPVKVPNFVGAALLLLSTGFATSQNPVQIPTLERARLSMILIAPTPEQDAIRQVKQSFRNLVAGESLEFSAIAFEGGIAVLYGPLAAYWIKDGLLFAVSQPAKKLSPELEYANHESVNLAAIQSAVRASKGQWPH